MHPIGPSGQPAWAVAVYRVGAGAERSARSYRSSIATPTSQGARPLRATGRVKRKLNAIKQEQVMELSSIWSVLSDASIDDALVWGVAIISALLALVALVNALDMFLDAEAG